MINFAIGRKAFLEEYFETKPLLSRNALDTDFYTWKDLDAAIMISETHGEGARLNKGGFIDESKYGNACWEIGYRKKSIIPENFYKEVNDGATIILNRIECVCTKSRLICAAISRFTGEAAIGNAYFANGKDESFGFHWDSHDVFAVQLKGKKRWLLKEPTFELPPKEIKSRDFRDAIANDPNHLDVEISEGDVLYIPRGWWHTAIPSDSPTLHIAVGIHTEKYHEVISKILNQRIQSDPRFRKTAQTNHLDRSLLAELLESLGDADANEKIIASLEIEKIKSNRSHSHISVERHLIEKSTSGLNAFDTIIVNTRQTIKNGHAHPQINGFTINLNELSTRVRDLLTSDATSITYGKLSDSLTNDEKESLNREINNLVRKSILILMR